MTAQRFTVGLDVGGTTMKAGVVGDDGRPLSSVSLPTDGHRGQTAGLDRMCETVRLAVAEAGLGFADISAIGVAAAGLLDLPSGVLVFAANMLSWKDVPVRRHVADTFGLPTAFLNDAKAAALGEYWAGAGRGSRSMVLFTLGTGIGGGIVVNDHVIEGEHGHGGEVGHIRIEMTRPRECPCGRLGCLEAYASATAVVQRTREALAEPGAGSVLMAGGELTARRVFDAAAEGDPLATGIVEETAMYLAVGAANLMHVIDPDVVVFGGGMAAAGEPFLDRIRWHIRRFAFPIPAERTRVVRATLGGEAGVIGAAAAARRLTPSE